MINSLSLVVHGESGVGKSWLGDTAPKPALVLDAEGGSRFTQSRKIAWDGVGAPPVPDGTWDTCVVTTRSFTQVASVYQWLASGQHGFRSVVLDSLTEIQKRCFVPDTEVLTPTGWQRLDELDVDASVAQWSPDGTISFATPSDRQTLPFYGELVSMPSVSSALLVTPDHRQPTLTQAGTFEVRQAETVRRGLRLPVAGIAAGQTDGPTTDEARLLAAYQADGTDPGHGKLYWGFTKERKIARLEALLDVVGASYKKTTYGSGITKFSVDRSSVPALDRWMPRKRWEWSALNWPLETRIALLEELRHWDGSHALTDRIEYVSAEPQNRDVVCALGALSGYASAVRVNGRVTLVSRTWRRLDKVERVAYAGEVRCLSVPSGFLLTRRKGKVTVSGNCLDDVAGIEQPTQADWGALLRRMEALVRQFRDLTMHPTKPLEAVVLICMTSEKGARFRPHVQGQLGITLPYFVDVVGYLFVQNDESGGLARRLLVQPAGQYDAKDRTNRLGQVVENPNVEQMIAAIYGVGTTAADPAGGAVEAGWLADPDGSGNLRYWDGQAWTEHISPT